MSYYETERDTKFLKVLEEMANQMERMNNLTAALVKAHTDAVQVVRCDEAPTIDVVPREDVDRLRHILNSYALQYGTVKDQHAVIDRIKQETAREIFAVIDTLGTYNPPLYAELKKKYTEENT